MQKLTVSNEDYLEAIYVLGIDGAPVKSVHIATRLNISKPAVNKALNVLHSLGYIEDFTYSDVVLTSTGKAQAKQVYKKHQLLHKFLVALGVSPSTAETDCCKIEHVISNETYAAIKAFMLKN